MYQYIETNLKVREINREGDIDYFIETLSYPINYDMHIEGMSRIQFPMSRAILVRTSPHSEWVTIHILRDIDLFSSFANFELKLGTGKLHIEQQDGYIKLALKE